MTHIFDIDGTLVKFHTNEWLPGAFEMLKRLHEQGDRLILITMRGPHDAGEEWSPGRTRQTILRELDDAGIQYRAMFDVPGPRTLYDDHKEVKAVHHEQNTPWE